MGRFWIILLAAPPLLAQAAGGRGEYVGGTLTDFPPGHELRLDLSDERYLALYGRRANLRVPYEQVNLLEYGQKVDRRYLAAALVSPLFLLSKSRQHFLTVGFADERGRQQAMVMRLDKGSIRPALVSLEARTGLRIQFQDEEARKAGKGS